MINIQMFLTQSAGLVLYFKESNLTKQSLTFVLRECHKSTIPQQRITVNVIKKAI